jgi:CheY-like chemotaxis protein
MRTILLVGRFPELTRQRREAFESAGYAVHASNDIVLASERIERTQYDAVVIGHGIDEDERLHLTHAVKARRPAPKLVYLYIGSIRNAELADAVLHDSSAEELVRSVELLFPRGERAAP